MSKRVRSGLLILALCAAIGPGSAGAVQEGLAGPSGEETLAQWTDRWIEGPVSLLATAEEKAIYDSLTSTTERLQFIRLFWERRDPTPRGPANEFLDTFADRVAYAEAEFENPREPGWQSVFGQVVLLFGPPDRTRRELGLPEGFSDRPPILWSYDERIPGLEPNEDLLFAFRAGRWRLMPQYPLDGSPIDEAMRQQERASNLPTLPSDYQRAFGLTVEASLRNTVNYAAIRDDVTTRVQLPDAQIPVSWTARVAAAEGDRRTVEIDLSWRVDSLVFHLVDGTFTTDMRVDVEVLEGGEPVATAGERVVVEIPETEMDGRREEVVRRTLTLQLPRGEYELELMLLDRLLGYRTMTRDTLSVQ
jgi:GWxTD domain-containing protein